MCSYALNATEFSDPAPSCNGGVGRGVWYTITPHINERVNISTCGSDFGTVLAVYTGSCDSLTQVQCANQGGPFCGFPGASLSFSGVAGTTYFILVGGNSGGGGNLQIVGTLSPPPANDSCANATPLVSGVTNFLYTFNATEFGDPAPSCVGCCSGGFGRGVWYTITTPTNNVRVNLSTCGSGFNTMMAVYTNSCGALTEVQCANEGGPFCNYQANLSFGSLGNTTYYILV